MNNTPDLLTLEVIICTDGKANSELGNLEVEDSDTRTLLSSTIFYQDLGDYAADHGLVNSPHRVRQENAYCSGADRSHEAHPSPISVTVSVLSIQGTDCRLDELGRLADRTGGEVRRVVCQLWSLRQDRSRSASCAHCVCPPGGDSESQEVAPGV